MKKDPRFYIEHIIESIDKILNYTRNMDEDAFLLNDLGKDAVVKNFEVIGEATKNIPGNFISAYPDIPWKNMAGMRDNLIHSIQTLPTNPLRQAYESQTVFYF